MPQFDHLYNPFLKIFLLLWGKICVLFDEIYVFGTWEKGVQCNGIQITITSNSGINITIKIPLHKPPLKTTSSPD